MEGEVSRASSPCHTQSESIYHKCCMNIAEVICFYSNLHVFDIVMLSWFMFIAINTSP